MVSHRNGHHRWVGVEMGWRSKENRGVESTTFDLKKLGLGTQQRIFQAPGGGGWECREKEDISVNPGSAGHSRGAKSNIGYRGLGGINLNKEIGEKGALGEGGGAQSNHKRGLKYPRSKQTNPEAWTTKGRKTSRVGTGERLTASHHPKSEAEKPRQDYAGPKRRNPKKIVLRRDPVSN